MDLLAALLIGLLGADCYGSRKACQRRLEQIGQEVVPMLLSVQTAAPEVQYRIDRLIALWCELLPEPTVEQ
jgi:hypothetical protein